MARQWSPRYTLYARYFQMEPRYIHAHDRFLKGFGMILFVEWSDRMIREYADVVFQGKTFCRGCSRSDSIRCLDHAKVNQFIEQQITERASDAVHRIP
jgi:hypothetical protein